MQARIRFIAAFVAAFVVTGIKPAMAQAPIPNGDPVTLEQAKKIIAAAEQEAAKNNWPAAIVDGKIVGAVGVSGVKSTEDAQIATAGLKALDQPAN